MRAELLKYLQLIDENKYTIAKILQKDAICEIKRSTNGLKISEVKKTVRR